MLSYQTYFIQYTISISMCLDKNAVMNVLEMCGNFTNFTISFRLNDSNNVVTITTVHPVLLKPFLSIPHVLGPNNIDLWEKTLKYRSENVCIIIRLGHSQLGCHLEYSSSSSPPHPLSDWLGLLPVFGTVDTGKGWKSQVCPRAIGGITTCHKTRQSLDYWKLHKGGRSTPPQISLYTSQR